MARSVFLNHVGVALGETTPIDELDELRRDPARLEAYTRVGFRSFHLATESVGQLARRAMADVLERSAVPASLIDAVVYCSETLRDGSYFEELHRSLDELGLENAYPIGLHLSHCGNLGSGLRIAISMLRSGELTRIMVVCADKTPLGDPARFLEPVIAIMSDGAAACILQADEESGWRVLGGVTQMVDHAQSRVPLSKVYCSQQSLSKEFLQYGLANCRGRKRSARQHFSRTEQQPKDFRYIITNNYGSTTIRAIAADIDVSQDAIFNGNLAKHAHVNSADPLISLRSLASTLEFGDRALVLSTGPYTWAYLSVQLCDAQSV